MAPWAIRRLRTSSLWETLGKSWQLEVEKEHRRVALRFGGDVGDLWERHDGSYIDYMKKEALAGPKAAFSFMEPFRGSLLVPLNKVQVASDSFLTTNWFGVKDSILVSANFPLWLISSVTSCHFAHEWLASHCLWGCFLLRPRGRDSDSDVLLAWLSWARPPQMPCELSCMNH